MNFINGQWQPGHGAAFTGKNPSTGATTWSGLASDAGDVYRAVSAAVQALPDWSATSLNQRIDVLNMFAEEVRRHFDDLSRAISDEVGKPVWDARTEVEALIAKIPLTIEAYHERCRSTHLDLNGVRGETSHRPLGVVAVFGPFNFPSHIANGQLAPALLAGNVTVFKPSELTPRSAELMVQLWERAGLPSGVLNLVQGGREAGESIALDERIQGILFTGSVGTGIALQQALVGRPDVLLALELGGNNPLVIHDISEIDAAVYWTIQSAYLSSGQRCTCTRRLIVVDGNDAYLSRLHECIQRIHVGRPDEVPEPFMGPVVRAAAADRVLAEQERLEQSGAQVIESVRRLKLGPAFLSPGLIDVTSCQDRRDDEIFGPLLQLIRVPTLEAAIAEANATRFGLVAALFSDDRAALDRFARESRAGVINLNRPTTGASGRLPFGGRGLSGNHRPAGFYMVDSCQSPVASLAAGGLWLPRQLSPGLNWS